MARINSITTIPLIAKGAIYQLKILASTNENSKDSMNISLVILEAKSIVVATILKGKFMKIYKKKASTNGGFFDSRFFSLKYKFHLNLFHTKPLHLSCSFLFQNQPKC